MIFPFWLVVGSVVILMGVFDKQILRILGLKPVSEVFTTPNLKHSSRRIEQIGRWLVITIGLTFFVQGLGEVLPDYISSRLSAVLPGLSGVLLLGMFGIAIANWRAR
jgi:hypothetical protein